MNEQDFENRLHSIAAGMEYPHTPEITGFVAARIRPKAKPRYTSKALVWSLVSVLIFLSSLMLIPPARAAIIEFIRIGIVRIFPRPTEIPLTSTPQSQAPVTAIPGLNALPMLEDLRRFAGERTLSEARELVPSSVPLRLPTYPSELGVPNRVFVQEADGVIVILVWLDPAQPERMLMSLHRIPETSWMIQKFEPEVIEVTSVNGQLAVWTVGPYPIMLSNGESDYVRMIDGNVLIWEENGITYRLETSLPLEEAVRIAESLQPFP